MVNTIFESATHSNSSAPLERSTAWTQLAQVPIESEKLHDRGPAVCRWWAIALVAIGALVASLTPTTTLAACSPQGSEQTSPSNEIISVVCDTREQAYAACDQLASSYNYVTACGHASYSPLFAAGWLCKGGPHQQYCPSGYVYLHFWHPEYFAKAEPPAESPSCDAVSDPIDPSNGAVIHEEADVGGAVNIAFARFYNSSLQESSNLSAGWRHSYSRRIKLHYAETYKQFSPSNQHSSYVYDTPSSACASGFGEIKSKIPGLLSATASYVNGVCTVQQGGLTVSTLPIFMSLASAANPIPQVVSDYLNTAGAVSVSGSQPKVVEVIRDDGLAIRFTSQGGGVYQPPVGTELTLTAAVDGFQIVDSNDSIETYDPNGRLLSVKARSGVILTMTYNASGQLVGVADSFGYSIGLSYDVQNRLASMTDSAARTTTYGYDLQNRLSSVTRPDSSTRTYLYENATFTSALTGLLNESGIRLVTWGYDSLGRGNSTYQAGGVEAASLTYNSNGTVTATDAMGAVRTFSFTRVGERHLTTAISGSQLPTCRTGKAAAYSPYGHQTSRTDYNNNVTQYTHDNIRGLETSRTEAIGTPRARTITTQWHPVFRLPMQVDEPGRRAVFTHDSNGNVLTWSLLDTATGKSRTWTYTYNAFGQMLTVDGPRTDISDVTTYTYHSCTSGSQCGRLQSVTNALGQTVSYLTYNASGQPLTISDANGVVSTLTYDQRNRVTSRAVAGEVTSYEYWPAGLLKRVTLPDGSFLLHSYDDSERLISIEDGEGNKIVLTLDAAGNVVKEENRDPGNFVTQTRLRVFDALNRLHQEVGAANTSNVTTTFGYDANGNLTNSSAPLGRNSSNQYDELNRLKLAIDANGGVTQLSFNDLDQLISVQDSRNLQTVYSYNSLGELTQLVSPDTGTTNNTYDSSGNLKTSTDARGRTATYTYDALDRLTQIVYDDQTIAYAYDVGTNAKGKLSGAGDSNHALAWSYDAQGRVVSKTQSVGWMSKTVAYGYTAGKVSAMTTPSGQSITYSYTNGKLTGLAVNGSAVVSNILYEPFGAIRGWTWGNGSIMARVRDGDGNLTHVDSAALYSYEYDDAFRVTAQVGASPGSNWTYGYNMLDRLTTANSSSISQVFGHDANGNRLSESGTSPAAYEYASSSNRLNSITGSMSRSYTYDAVGNVTNDGTHAFSYNGRGRLATVQQGYNSTTYRYNALGQRIVKTGAGIGQFFYDESGHLLGEYNPNGVLLQEIVWLGDIPVASLRRNASGGIDIYYIHTDHLNTPRKITRPSDNKMRWMWNPSPFGGGAPNEDPEALGAFTFNLRFPGQYFDSETGNFYNYFRYYDPSTGRYIESDPIGLLGGINTYTYAHNSPTMLVDRLGLLVSGGRTPKCRTIYGDTQTTSRPWSRTLASWQEWDIKFYDIRIEAGWSIRSVRDLRPIPDFDFVYDFWHRTRKIERVQTGETTNTFRINTSICTANWVDACGKEGHHFTEEEYREELKPPHAKYGPITTVAGPWLWHSHAYTLTFWPFPL